MNIYLIGNYNFPYSKSMDLYAKIIKKIIKKKNIKIKILYPSNILNFFDFKIKFIKKYLGYFDKYLFFGIKLFFLIKKNDIVHICDQANSILHPFILSKYKIITCHDLIMINYLKNKNNNLSISGKIYQKLILYYLNKFKNIICVSSNTLRDLSKYIKIKNKNVIVIHNSINLNDYDIKFKQKKIINKKYFLHVGSDIFYKNKINLIKIYNEILKKNKNYKLILAGGENNKKTLDIIYKLKLQNDIIQIYKPSFNNLKSLYLNAEALLFPSLYEGFGIPIIEAQASGCPVFTSNLPAMNEVGLNSVNYIYPLNPKKSAKIILNKLKNKKHIILKGFKNVKRFNQKLISNQLLNFYKKIYNS